MVRRAGITDVDVLTYPIPSAPPDSPFPTSIYRKNLQKVNWSLVTAHSIMHHASRPATCILARSKPPWPDGVTPPPIFAHVLVVADLLHPYPVPTPITSCTCPSPGLHTGCQLRPSADRLWVLCVPQPHHLHCRNLQYHRGDIQSVAVWVAFDRYTCIEPKP